MRRRRWVPRVLLAGAAVGLIGAAPTERPEYHEARRVSARIVQDTLALLVKELEHSETLSLLKIQKN